MSTHAPPAASNGNTPSRSDGCGCPGNLGTRNVRGAQGWRVIALAALYPLRLAAWLCAASLDAAVAVPPLTALKPCTNCGRPFKPLCRGRCQPFAVYLHRNESERPYVHDGRREKVASIDMGSLRVQGNFTP